MPAPIEIINAIRKHRFSLTSEAELQKQVAEALRKSGIPVEREYRLDGKSRIDFFCDGVGIEAKIKGGAKDIYKQCERYCGFSAIHTFVLITNRAMGFPGEIKGKPCYVVSLGMSWL